MNVSVLYFTDKCVTKLTNLGPDSSTIKPAAMRGIRGRDTDNE